MVDSETLQVEMFPAAHGDAFLLRHVDGTGATNILVDAGLATTYRQAIKPRLLELASAKESLDLFIVTHIDSDHIEGALDFIADNGPSATPNVISVRDVWHNSYRHLPFEGRPATPDEIRRVREQAYSPAVSGPGEITARQGTTLAALGAGSK
jgi:glyoxylase-like metal-dependent hydrolase (beta-lactamase superfamily II)